MRANFRARRFERAHWAALCVTAALFLISGVALVPVTAQAATSNIITVTNLNDLGSGSLRAAISTATSDTSSSQYEIVFAPGLSGTITLNSTLPEIENTLTIDGGGDIAISGDNAYRVMSVNSTGTLKLENITIEDGNAGSDDNVSTYAPTVGGGIYNNGGTLTVTDSTLLDNSADDGGGIYNNVGSVLSVTDSTFSHNSATGEQPNDGGGGIYSNTGSLSVTDSTFSSNSATYGAGAGIFSGGGTVADCTFSGNSASSGGGGILNGAYKGLPMSVTNTTFVGNSATYGGGGVANIGGGGVFVTNSTFSGNSATYGAGVYNQGSAFFKGTIVAGSPSGSAEAGDNCYNDPSGNEIIDNGYNISSDDSCGFSPSDGSANNPDLMLGSLANNGGPTETISLASGSPAIDAIPVTDCTDQASPPNQLTTDQRGYTRPDEGESACDIGAYESGAMPPPALSSATSLDLEPSTGSFDLNSSITFAGAVDPVGRNVMLQIGSYSVTIPAGSFIETKKGDYVFQGTIGGVSLQVRIVPAGDGSYTLQAQGSGANLSGTTNPVAAGLTITDANGDLLAGGGILATASIN